MSRTETPWNLPDRTVARAEEADREIRISDFTLMAILPLRSVGYANFPINELAMLALVGLCLFRSSRRGARLPSLVVILLGALLALLVYSGTANEVDWTRRVGHVGIMAGLIWAFGTGRISMRSAALGLSAGLITVIALAVAGIGGNTYPGRLTGFLSDPNAGAYFIAALGLVAIFYSDDRWKVRLAISAPLLAGLVLTYSRTGLLATAFALIWVVIGRRLGSFYGVVLAGALVWVANNIPDSLTTVGPFSDRSGSDKLRERIIAQERVQLADVPWFGNGPGTARVSVRDLEFFFHNSYFATRQEGGWVALILVLSLLVYAFLRLSARARRGDMAAVGAQAGIVAVAVMAITLGEVLLDTPMAIVVGFALGQALMPDPQPEEAGAPDG